MTLEQLRNHCLGKANVEETFPFDSKTLVFKVSGKMFLLVDVDQPVAITVKCDPQQAIILREKYTEIVPGYHTNKRLWNTISLQGDLPDAFILQQVDHSYHEVLKKLPRSQQKLL